MTGPRLTVADVRAAGLCVRGIQAWCRERGIDFRAALLDGMPMEDVERFLPDAFIERAMEQMHKRTGGT